MVAVFLLGCVPTPLELTATIVLSWESSPAEIERSVVEPLERALAGLPVSAPVRSSIDARGARLEVRLREEALEELPSRLQAASRDLPRDAPRPEIRISRPQDERMWLKLREGADAERVASELSALPAVVERRLCAPTREVRVLIDPARLQGARIGLLEIEAAIQSAGVDLLSVSDLPALTLGGQHLLSDVATIEVRAGRSECVGHSSSGPIAIVELSAAEGGDREVLRQKLDATSGIERIEGVVAIELRRDPARPEVAAAVAAATGEIVLDQVDGTGLLLAKAEGAVERARAVPGVIAAWDPAETETLRLSGPDYDVLDRLASATIASLEAAGASAAYVIESPPRPSIDLVLDREDAARFGVELQTIAATAASALGGLPAGHVRDGGQRMPLVLKLGEGSGIEAFEVAQLPSSGGLVPLSALAERSESVERSRLRVDGQRAIEIAASGLGEEGRGEVLAGLALPEGYRALWAR